MIFEGGGAVCRTRYLPVGRYPARFPVQCELYEASFKNDSGFPVRGRSYFLTSLLA
jgi:hypothetical protein